MNLDLFAPILYVFYFVLQNLRQVGVVGKFVEFYGPGVAELSIADRATIANMCPEYGATMGYFPVDGATISYLTQTGKGGLDQKVANFSNVDVFFAHK